MIIFSTEKKYRDRNPQRFAVGFLFCFANWVLCKPPTPRRGRGRESRGRAPCLQYSPVQNSARAKATRISQWVPSLSCLCPVYDSGGNRPGQFHVVISMARNNSTSNAQRARRLRDRALANAQIIQFAPYLARKQEQERLIHHSPIVEGDIRARVAALIEWSARY
jgi:hypothetical protein